MGFVILSKEDYVYLLKKTLYRLKQYPRQLYNHFDAFVASHVYSKSQMDSCVYFKRLEDGYLIYLLLSIAEKTIECWV